MTDKAVLLSDIEFVEMHSDDWERIERESFEIQKQPQINENQQMLSGSELIGVIYSQLLEDFGFEYIEKDLWMIAENLSEKIANDQPQLNPNQQIVLDWLKNRYTGNADPFGVAACLFSQTPRSEVIVATLKLTKDEQAQVLKIFANWTLEQVEDL
ncbi:hypothetical protein ACFC8T_13615 [Enterococcus casseliflavus]|uniref:hypothetical protein n=1 Tax=Enterococcus casseliflavus TaxID=37734 RepID=UPI0039A59E1F|nr:hypothetical protein [Enterococcus casseliflavus]